MIGLGLATKVYVAVGATDLRKGFEGLFGLVRDRLQVDPLSGHLLVFCNAGRTRLKVLYWDGSAALSWISTHSRAFRNGYEATKIGRRTVRRFPNLAMAKGRFA
jgi:transposase